MQPESGLRTWQWVVTAIVIVVLIIIGIFVFGKKAPSAPTTGDNMSSSTPAINQPGDNSIIMSDQFPGNVVYISWIAGF